MLEKYNPKFDLDIEKYAKDPKYKEKRKGSLSLEDEKFLQRYEKKFEDLKKEEFICNRKKRF